MEEPSTECETCTETEIPQNPAIELLKDGVFNDENGDGFGNEGETISYNFTVTNTGNVTLTNITVTDPKVNVTGGPISLAPGASDNATFTATYVLTQDDIDAGYVVNTALAEGTAPNDEVVEDESSDPTPVEEPNTECETCTETEIPQNPAIQIVKSDNGAQVSKAGDVITYTLTVTNTGNVTLTNVQVNDPLTGLATSVGTLAPAAIAVVNTNYTVTQADVDKGSVLNKGLTSGESPDEETPTDEDDEETPIERNPSIQIVKSDNGAQVSKAGDVITYTLTVTNTGNVTLTNVLVNDPLTGLATSVGTLAPAAIAVVNTNYTVTQADVDKGSVLNKGLTSGESPDEETPTDEDDEETPIERNPAVTLDKSVDLNSVSVEGVVLNYTLTVKNTGNVTLSNGTLTDPKTGLSVPGITLVPGEEKTYSTTYTVTLQDLFSGEPIVNVAEINLVDGQTGTPYSAQDDAVVEVDLTPSITIEKISDVSVVSEAGEVINYTLTVTNNGTAPLTNVVVKDPLTGFEAKVELLLAGQVRVFETSYTVTIADIAEQAPIVNVAVVTADDPTGGDPLEEQDDNSVSVECTDATLITGIIFNAMTDQPLAGVPVTLVPQESTPGDILITVTGADGRYTFKDFAPGQYLVQVQDANLNAARGLYPVQSSLFFTLIEACKFQTKDFGYETYDGIVLGDFVWYDLNQDGIQNEWFDADNDGQVTLNDPQAGPISIRDWEWFDLNGDGRYDGPENEGELNKAGFGNDQSANIKVTGPNGYEADVIVGILGYWRDRPEGTSFGEYTATFVEDEFIQQQASFMQATGKVKILPNSSGRMTDINAVRTEERCGLTTENFVTKAVTTSDRVHLDMDFGWRCLLVDVEIIANDDDFGSHFVSFGGLIGNILENDRLEGQRPDPADVDFEFTELDGIIGLLIDDNGELSLIPNVNEVRDYTLRYILRETDFPENNDDALVFFRILNDNVDLEVTKTSFEAEIYEGDEFEYEIVVRNIGGTPASGVTIVDNLPASVSYLSSRVVSVSDQLIQVGTPSVTGSTITWNVPFLPADGVITLRVTVKAGDAGQIQNVVVVGSEEDDTNVDNNTDTDVNQVLPFRIPNVITPNSDGDNDTFEIKGLGKFEASEIVILNRYGDHVLEKTNYQNDWDAPGQVAGTYFYVLKLTDRTGKVHEFTGWIQVIKE